MDQNVLAFLNKERISVLSTILKDGSPHGATLHFSHTETPLTLYFSTENTSRKYQALQDSPTTKATCVLGFSEQEWITLQLDGEVRAVKDPAELKKVQDIHYAKHPNSAKFKDDPATVFLAFTPSWWRFTDYNTSPVTILSSEK